MRQARNLALKDAKKNFIAATESCQKHKWRIVNIREESHGFPLPAPQSYAYRAKAQEISAPVIAPVRFEDIKIEVTFNVTFGFDGALCYEKPAGEPF